METNKINETVGAPFEDMELTEMENTQGAGDVDAETTPVIIASSAGCATGAAAITGAVSGVVISVKKC